MSYAQIKFPVCDWLRAVCWLTHTQRTLEQGFLLSLQIPPFLKTRTWGFCCRVCFFSLTPRYVY